MAERIVRNSRPCFYERQGQNRTERIHSSAPSPKRGIRRARSASPLRPPMDRQPLCPQFRAEMERNRKEEEKTEDGRNKWAKIDLRWKQAEESEQKRKEALQRIKEMREAQEEWKRKPGGNCEEGGRWVDDEEDAIRMATEHALEYRQRE
ncbi:hypothetical protein M501DRAFT_991085 [Patellaria atrata CBS 101060]|uniref:Uncharacterized protein n=1 Tax=Patellaria atrata CBS 101060 TaxID=1346257 RepID=A0A9P4VSN3_9PEZI|nr:hypothetical protein M501DRAFT_991085 [Patellaria atrata CBS 101060]